MDSIQKAIGIFKAAVEAVNPSVLIHHQVRWNKPHLIINDHSTQLKSTGRIFILGAGKASALMAQAMEDILGDDVYTGLVITKHGHGLSLNKTKVLEAGHPVPDSNSVRATKEMLDLLTALTPDDVVLFLLSGGASSLLADFPEGSDLPDLQKTFEVLLKSGADIHEMNTVRKHLSNVKGGQFARKIYPAKLFSLVLSDVIGDDLDVIGSGPTVPDKTSFEDARNVLLKYRIEDKVPASVYRYILAGCAGIIPDTPKPDDPGFRHTHNLIIGNNKIALEAAASKAREAGYHAHIVTNTLRGEAADVGKMLAQKAIEYTGPFPACLLYGGETTTNVTGNGLGGRNTELVLAAGMSLLSYPGLTLLSGGTDGTDGPTDAAGAVVTADMMKRLIEQGRSPQHYLGDNDSYHFFSNTEALIKTGPTQTNVMDIVVTLIDPSNDKSSA